MTPPPQLGTAGSRWRSCRRWGTGGRGWARSSRPQRYGELNGNHLAAAITLAGFISLFPLLLVAIAVLGFFSHQSVDWRLTSSTVSGSPARRRRSFLASFAATAVIGFVPILAPLSISSAWLSASGCGRGR